jgi:sec-independent protein translocase protein TatA
MQLLAGLGPLGLPELAIIAFIVVLVFGVGRLPEVGGAVGKGIREFRKATKDDDAAADASTLARMSADPSPAAPAMPEASAPAPAAPADPDAGTIFCGECGGKNLREAKFCAHCGHGITATIS